MKDANSDWNASSQRAPISGLRAAAGAELQTASDARRPGNFQSGASDKASNAQWKNDATGYSFE
jgi:hypothetical protein